MSRLWITYIHLIVIRPKHKIVLKTRNARKMDTQFPVIIITNEIEKYKNVLMR